MTRSEWPEGDDFSEPMSEQTIHYNRRRAEEKGWSFGPGVAKAMMARSMSRVTLDSLYATEICECLGSPIERAMFLAMMLYWDTSAVFVSANSPDGEREAFFDGNLGATLFVKCQQRLGPYVADFVLGCSWSERPCLHSTAFEQCRLVIECDGHDFHERTKEQAAHDRSRDRWMTANGYVVLRFTGSEIYRDALGCVSNIDSVLHMREGWERFVVDDCAALKQDIGEA